MKKVIEGFKLETVPLRTLLVCDVSGSISHTSRRCMTYDFVLFKEATTSYRRVYYMKKESDVSGCFKIYNAVIMKTFHFVYSSLHSESRWWCKKGAKKES